MGNRPSAPSAAQAEELERRLPELACRAACAIHQADILFLCTGAGWSADSGLAVYRDVADVAAYRDRNLTYRDICQPSWLETDPELFYGFWGGCYNDYRNVKPHEGYHMVQAWVEQRFRHGRVADALRVHTHNSRSSFEDFFSVSREPKPDASTTAEDAVALVAAQDASATAPAAAEGSTAGAFFTFTSNVDAHSHHVFHGHEIYECHGNSESWQCADRECARHLAEEKDPACMGGRWRAPEGHRFHVDDVTRNAADDEPAIAAASEVGSRAPQDGGAFRKNWPRCVRCGGLARPAILMFGDMDYVEETEAESHYDEWQRAVYAVAPSMKLKVAVLEVGCGANVTTVRRQAEAFVEELIGKGVDASLIRINPDFPLADERDFQPRTLSLFSRGLVAVSLIDASLRRLMAGEPPPFATPFESYAPIQRDDEAAEDEVAQEVVETGELEAGPRAEMKGTPATAGDGGGAGARCTA